MRKMTNLFFQQLYMEDEQRRPNLDNLQFKMLCDKSRDGLEEPFTKEEIKGSLDDCNGDMAPDPDGFNMKFYQVFWDVIKKDVLAVFNDFHRAESFVNSINSTFLILIPKVVGAKDIKKYRPISLVRSIYKLISKVLTKRLSKVLGEVIGKSQNAFVEGGQILDAVMIASELVDELVGLKKEGILCKIDMEKAYDHVCWDFVDYMLRRMSFGCKWRTWVMKCISTTSFTVMVNGGPSNFFKASRGLRQGDLLPPLLFLTIMKAFNRLIEKAGELKLLNGVAVGRGEESVKISHLFFADDTLIFCEPTVNALLHLRCILLCF